MARLSSPRPSNTAKNTQDPSACGRAEAGQPNEVCHLWAYGDLNARAATAVRPWKDPGWQTFPRQERPLLEEMHSTVLLPAPTRLCSSGGSTGRVAVRRNGLTRRQGS